MNCVPVIVTTVAALPMIAVFGVRLVMVGADMPSSTSVMAGEVLPLKLVSLG